MKKLFLILSLIISANAFATNPKTLLETLPPYSIPNPYLAVGTVDICSLPATNTGLYGDWLIKEDSTCINGTKKIKVLDFITHYIVPYITASTTDSVHVGVSQVGYGNTTTGLLKSDANFTRTPTLTNLVNVVGVNESQLSVTPTRIRITNTGFNPISNVQVDSIQALINYGGTVNLAGINANNSELQIINYSNTWKWPHTDGTANQVLKTDGAGVLGWTSSGGGSGWSLTGNSGTNPVSNFIGTIDTSDFIFKIHNTFAGVISENRNNTSFGQAAGGTNWLQTIAGGSNSSFGQGALDNISTGNSNTAIGQSALNGIQTGTGNIGIGAGADVLSGDGGINNAMVFGLNAKVGCTNCTSIGDSTQTQQVGIGYSTPSAILGANTGLAINGRIAVDPADAQPGYILTATDVLGNCTWQTSVGSGWSLTGNSGTNSGTNSLGTIDNASLKIITNDTARVVVDSLGRIGIGTTSPTADLSVFSSNGFEQLAVNETNPINISGLGRIYTLANLDTGQAFVINHSQGDFAVIERHIGQNGDAWFHSMATIAPTSPINNGQGAIGYWGAGGTVTGVNTNSSANGTYIYWNDNTGQITLNGNNAVINAPTTTINSNDINLNATTNINFPGIGVITGSGAGIFALNATHNMQLSGVDSIYTAIGSGDFHVNGILKINDGTQGTGKVLTSDANGLANWQTPASGTVTSVSVVTANGISGTVATATTTPAITLTLSSISSGTTATTQSANDNSTKIATTAYVATALSSVPTIVAKADSTAQTVADANITSYTTSAIGTYRVGGYITITAIATNTINFKVSYTDENSNVQTLTFFPQGLTSAALATTGAFAFPTMDIRVKSGTTITMLTTATGIGSQVYDVGSVIMKLY